MSIVTLLLFTRSASEPNDVDAHRESPEPWFRTFPGRTVVDVPRSTSPPPWFIAEPHTPVARDFEVFENVRHSSLLAWILSLISSFFFFPSLSPLLSTSLPPLSLPPPPLSLFLLLPCGVQEGGKFIPEMEDGHPTASVSEVCSQHQRAVF